ncbi:MAG TPA: TetR family transcriptional regulator [Sporichthyaceae bacterium]|nr:TetR family transcriptional regulator [Sporichthyaceae bacterium]
MAVVRDAELTRRKLLSAARREFAAFGIDGARIDRIAAQAGVNKERVYGHFGSKDALFAAAVEAALDELAESVSKPGQDLEAWVGAVYDFHRSRSELVRLLMWESLHAREEELPGEEKRLERYGLKVQAMAASLGCPAGPEAAAVLLCLIGLAAWPSAVPQLTRQIVRPQVRSVREQDRVIRDQILQIAKHVAAGARVTSG